MMDATHWAVSVVTINLNNCAGLEVTRDSLVRQTALSSVEWIVMDGGSTDRSMEVASAAAGTVQTHLSSGPDRGIYDAMNRGWRRSAGDLVVFMNSGDCFTDSTVVQRVIERRVRGDWRWGYGCTRQLTRQRAPYAVKSFAPFRLERLALGLATVPHQTVFMERALLEELGGFDEKFGVAADQELLLRAALMSAPEVWIDLMADLEPGGVGSVRGPRDHPRDMRRASRQAGVTLYGSAAVHSCAALGVSTYSTLMDVQSKVRWRLMDKRS